MLEFANRDVGCLPVLQFRVSSHMLAETSPIFANIFCSHGDQGPEMGAPSAETKHDVLPPPPAPFICKDGSRTLLYRMPQLEDDKEAALTILLHAAHMHNDRVPREVSFEQFVALAEVSLRYKCTSPLELFVEHRWLPQWVHKATDAMPDGLVVISYAFGLRRLFTRVTKTAILNLVDERELATKGWPKGIKERIWAVRCAKMAQVHQTCARALEEYLRPPSSPSPSKTGCVSPDATEGRASIAQTPTPVGSPPRPPSSYTIFSQPTTSTLNLTPPSVFPTPPRCPRGSHSCDATNLGWLLLLYNSLHLLPSSPFLTPSSPVSVPSTPLPSSPPRSLAQLVESLRAIPSPPPTPHQYADHRSSSSHPQVCDPVPAFRAAVNDVYNSVAGLTLYEIDGARHGWALSARHAGEPQAVHRVGGGGGEGDRRRPAAGGNVVDELAVAMGGLVLDGEAGVVTAVMGRLGLEEEVGEGGRRRGRVPAEEAFRNEGICLRILGGMDSFDDLHNAAVVNRNMHAVYKENEVELMRHVVAADRRRTVMLLAGEDGKDSEAVDERRSKPSLSPDVEGYLRRLAHKGAEPTSRSHSLPGNDDSSIPASTASDSGTGTGAAPSTTSGSGADTPVRTASPAPSSSGASRPSVLSRRSTARSLRSTTSGVNPYFKMTEEEARRILWGEPSPPLSPLLSAPEVRAFRAESHVIEDTKFGVTGGLVVEDKMLVTGGNKQLREDMDRRIGLA